MNIDIFNDTFDDTRGVGDDLQLSKSFTNDLKISSTPTNGDTDSNEMENHRETIEYFEYDILSFIKFIINTIPCKDYTETGNILIQMIRYNFEISSNKSNAVEAILSLMELLCDKIKLFIMHEENKTNFLTRSYWLGVINYLFFKLYKEDDYHFFKVVPGCLEIIVDLIRFLMITNIDSINDQITNELIVNNILYYYEEDTEKPNDHSERNEIKYRDERNWLWKHRKKNKLLLTNAPSNNLKRSSIDIEPVLSYGLSPPPLEEQACSPIKVCHILNSLVYVLSENNISLIIQKQIINFVLIQIVNKTFNNFIDDDAIKTRDRAIKIKLNLLMIQDWCKEHDLKHPVNTDLLNEIDDFILETYPQNLLPDNFEPLKNVYSFEEKSSFYYKNSLKTNFNIECTRLNDMLEFLTIMSNFNDKQQHKTDFIHFVEDVSLNKHQLLKLINGYRYEVDEPSFRFKKLIEKDIVKPLGKDQNGLHLSETSFKNMSKITIPFTKEIITQYSKIRERVDEFNKLALENIHKENLKKYGNPSNFDKAVRKPQVMKKITSIEEPLVSELDGVVGVVDGAPGAEQVFYKEDIPTSVLPVVSEYLDENPW